MSQKPNTACPASISNIWLNIVSGILFFAIMLYLLSEHGALQPEDFLIAVGLAIIPCILRDLLVQKASGYFSRCNDFSLQRILTKITGLYASYAFVGLLYWLLPEYGKDFFERWWVLLEMIVPWMLGLAIPYVILVDRYMENPKDAYWHMGKLILASPKTVDMRIISGHLKGWVVKGFFLPLMSTFLINNMQGFARFDGHFEGFMEWFYFLNHLLFSIDLFYAAIGYVFTLRLLNTQIFSSEPTTAGWAACLAGYSPFWPALLYGAYFNYDNGFMWNNMTAHASNLQVVWGSMIILCLVIYSFATTAFGYRFSNLTYRGLITNGPYRFTKHPAYIFKNISWWMISVPFYPHLGWDNAIKCSILLALVNLIYYIRARTEENHLSNYPEYVEYAEWMNEHGIFRWIGNLFPYLRYDRARAERSGSRVYAPLVGRPTTKQALSGDAE